MMMLSADLAQRERSKMENDKMERKNVFGNRV